MRVVGHKIKYNVQDVGRENWSSFNFSTSCDLLRPEIRHTTSNLVICDPHPMQIRFYRLQNTKRRMHKCRKLGELQLSCPAASQSEMIIESTSNRRRFDIDLMLRIDSMSIPLSFLIGLLQPETLCLILRLAKCVLWRSGFIQQFILEELSYALFYFALCGFSTRQFHFSNSDVQLTREILRETRSALETLLSPP